MEITGKDIRNDIKSGISVFLVAIPLCLGIALASGAPVISGIISGIIGGIIIGFASGSRLSVSGPAAGLVAIMLTAINELGSFNMVLTATIIAGALQLIFGYLRAGIIAHYVPYSVVKGMLAAVGLILILKQIPHSVGYDGVFEGSLSFWQEDGRNTFSELLVLLDNFTIGPVIISLISFILLYILSNKKIQQIAFFNFMPASLIVIGMGALINKGFMEFYPALATTAEHLVQLPDVLGQGSFTEALVSPDWSAFQILATYKQGFIIAVIASIETLLCIEAADKLDPYKRVTPTNRELKAQGLGNVISGFLGGLPITSVIVRTSVNIENKAKTKLSTIVHGILLVVSLLGARPLINSIPLASLACILIVIGYKLTNRKLIKDMFAKGTDQFAPFIVTIVAVLLTDLMIGVLIGLVVSIFLVLRNYYRMQSFDLISVDEKNQSYKIHFTDYTTFLSKASLENSLSLIPKNSKVELDFSDAKMIDYEVIEMLEDFHTLAKEDKISVKVKNSKKNKFVLNLENNTES